MDCTENMKTFTIEFIELYRQNPCLWKIRDPDYHNRNKKDVALNILVNKYKEVYTLADKKMVTAKINNLRTRYRTELKKLREINPSGFGLEEDWVYEGNLYFFRSIDFLRDQESPRISVSNIEEIPAAAVLQTTQRNDSSSSIPPPTPSTPTESVQNNVPSTSAPVVPASAVRNGVSKKISPRMANPYSRENRKKQKSVDSTEHDFMASLTAKLNEKDKVKDSYGEVIAKAWAHQYDNVAENQKIHVEKLMNDVLYAGRLGQLNESSKIVTDVEYVHVPLYED